MLGPEKGGILTKGLKFGNVHPGTQESKPATHPHSKEASVGEEDNGWKVSRFQNPSVHFISYYVLSAANRAPVIFPLKAGLWTGLQG